MKDQTTIYNNQMELSRSAEQLDDQFAIITRICVRHINGGELGPVSYENINEMFKEWGLFKSLDNFRVFTKNWYMGEPIEKILTEAKAALEELKKGTSTSGDTNAEGIAGNETVEQQGSGDTGEDASNPVPPLPSSDQGPHESEE
jgi:hypothetical protein